MSPNLAMDHNFLSHVDFFMFIHLGGDFGWVFSNPKIQFRNKEKILYIGPRNALWIWWTLMYSLNKINYPCGQNYWWNPKVGNSIIPKVFLAHKWSNFRRKKFFHELKEGLSMMWMGSGGHQWGLILWLNSQKGA